MEWFAFGLLLVVKCPEIYSLQWPSVYGKNVRYPYFPWEAFSQ